MAYYIGKTGFVSVTPSAGGAAVRLPLSEWSLETENDKVDFSNFESSGAKSIAGGFFGGSVSASGPYEGGAITSSAILTDFRAGKIVLVKLGLIQTGTLGFAVNVLLDSVSAGMDAKEKGTFEFSGTLTNMDNSLTIQASQNASLAPA
jgi:hypothetical protein